MKKIGPHLTVQDDFVPNMQTAYESDNERGAHWLNNAAAEQLNKEWPTVISMAALIEQEWDELKRLFSPQPSDNAALSGDTKP